MYNDEESEVQSSIKYLDDKPIVLLGARDKIGVLMSISTAFLTLGVWEIFQKGYDRGMRITYVGYFSVLFFSAGVIASFMLFIKPPTLTLTSKGFDLRYGMSRTRRRWEEIQTFQICHLADSGQDLAGYTKAGGSEQAFSQQYQSRGYDGSFPDIFDLEPQELVYLLEAARRRWSPTSTFALLRDS